MNYATPDRLPDLVDSMRLCIDDIKDWMTDNKLKLNDDKTEVMIITPSRMSTVLSIPDSFDVGNAPPAQKRTFANISQPFVEHLFGVLFVCKRLCNVCAVCVTFIF